MAGKRIDAIAYRRTSSAANVGSDKDSDKRQRAAIASFAKAHGYRIVDEFYDSAVSGADPVAERPGFKAMLDRIAGNGGVVRPLRASRGGPPVQAYRFTMVTAQHMIIRAMSAMAQSGHAETSASLSLLGEYRR